MSLTIHLPESWKEFIDSEVAAGGHGTPENYIQAILQDVQIRKARQMVEALLEEGLNSGEATEWTKQDADDIRREVEEHLAQRRRTAS